MDSFRIIFINLIKCIVTLIVISSLGSALNAQSLRLNKSVSDATPAPGVPFNFILDIACQSTTAPCEDVYISDFIPASLEFLNFSSPLPTGVSAANYNAGTNEAVINFNSDEISAGTSIQIEIQVRFPNGTFNGTQADNTANAYSSNAGDVSSSASATSTGGTTGGNGCDALPNEVGGDWTVVSPGVTSFWAEVGNTGSTTIQNWQYETTIQSNLELDFVRTPEFPGVNHTGDLYYQESNNPGTWVFWDSFNLNSREHKNVSGLGLGTGITVSALKIELGDLPGTGEFNPYIYPDEYNRHFLYAVKVPAGLQVGSDIENCGTYSGNIGGTACNTNDCFNTTISEGEDWISSAKYMTDLADTEQTSYNIGETVRVHMEFASPAAQPNDIVGAVMTDILPAGMTYIANSWSIEWGEHVADFQTPHFEGGTMPDGRDFVRFIWDAAHGNEFTIEPTGAWEGFSIEFEATIDAGISQGFHTNEMYANATGSVHDDCGTPDTENYLNGYANSYCYNTYDFEVIYPPGSAGLESKKEVKGSLNAGYNQYPAFGTTVPGGVNDYRITLSNPNSTPVDDLVILEIFPYVGDTEILNPSDPRFSEWRPNLLNPITTPTGGIVYYTTVINPCRDEVAAPGDPTPFPSGCTPAAWSTTPPSDITLVTGFKIDLGNRRLDQHQEFVLEWEMRAPVTAPTSGELAWNSFAWAGSNATTGNPLLPAEPIKVGIESFPGSVPFHGDFVWYDTDGDGIQDPGELGADGVTITLYQDNGDGIPNVASDTPYMTTVSANGGQYLFSDFPLGDYFVVFSNLPSGYNPTHTNAGSNDNLDSDGLITPVMSFTSTTDDRSCDLGIYEGKPPTQCTCIANGCPDKDGDGISDNQDYDSDNDGILNVDEGFECETVDLSPYNGSKDALTDFNAAMIDIGNSIIQVTDPLTFFGGATLDEFSINDDHDTGNVGLQLGVFSDGPHEYLESEYTFGNPVCGFNGRIVDLDRTDAIEIFAYSDGVLVSVIADSYGSCVSFDGINKFESICNVQASPANGNVQEHALTFTFNSCIDRLVFRMYDQGPGSGGSFTFQVSPQESCSGIDCDFDGVPDYLDLDSDNDGIPDAVEVCGNINVNLIDCMLVDPSNLTQVDHDNDGCPDGVITSCTPIDTDNDGIDDYKDLDSDNDGCSDSNEGGSADNPNVNNYTVNQGYDNPAAAVNECGLVLFNSNAECHIPSNTNWINSSTSSGCCEIIASIDNSCTILNSNNGFEDAGGTSFSTTYNGVPAALLPRSSTIIPGFTADYSCTAAGPCPDSYWINDSADAVNNPEGDKFVILTQQSYCMRLSISLTAGECYDLSAYGALYNSSSINGDMIIEYLDDSSNLVAIGSTTFNSSTNFNSLNWTKVSTTFTPTQTKSYSLFFTFGNPSGPFTGGFALDDIQVTPCCNEICLGESITLLGNSSGGQGTVNYSWSSGQNTQNITVNPNSTQSYELVVTDSEGCQSTAIATVVVNELPDFNITNPQDVSCNGLSDGSVTIQGIDGHSPYTFTVSGEGTNTTGVYSNLSAGNYNVTIEDSNGCEGTGSFTVNEPDHLECTANRVKYVDCNCQDNGSAIANVTGGTAPYQYLWSNGEITQTAVALNIGTYTVVITDNNNCTTTCSIEMEQDPDCCSVIMHNGFIRHVGNGN